jgi:hypothetical protein
MVQMLSIVIAAFNRFAAVIFKTGFDTVSKTLPYNVKIRRRREANEK